MCHHMFEGLVKWADDGEGNAVTVPGQAESWDKETNDDGTVTYTVHLRDGIKWSDGQAVTAGDFRVFLETSGKPGNSSRLLLHDRHGKRI